jgi:cbb3-type cytochrome oxidase subunit 3
MDENGNSKLKENAMLPKLKTAPGTAYAVKDTSESSVGNFFTRPIVWIFLALILLGIIFIILRKRKKKNQYGSVKTGITNIGGGLFKKKINPQSEVKNIPWENRAMPLSKESKLQTKNKANLSLSIKGNKQDISIVDVTIKNLGEVQEKKGNAEEPLQKIIYTAENKKAFVYENQNNLFFILTPSKTRTFKNEDAALEIAQTAKEVLSAYNKVAKYRLDFGISIEHGSIVEKTENGVMEFMSLGTLMSNAKKIASASQGEVLLGEKIKEKLINVRTEKQDNGRITFYKIKDIKYHDEEHSKFIKNFVKKNEDNFGRSTTSNQTTNANKTPAPASTSNNSQSTDPKSLIKGFY